MEQTHQSRVWYADRPFVQPLTQRADTTLTPARSSVIKASQMDSMKA